ncbi:hypothetical protein [Chitinophaga defluvii]|uniref:HEPN domain-containing protein n=1 Tax=Chitinophaga defluvii TaxID=3163343 RepID=A0ABV2TB75_9BACT
MHTIEKPLLFSDLHMRMRELSQNFKGFVQSECNMTTTRYYFLVRNPEYCSAEELEIITKVAIDLSEDLQALLKRYPTPSIGNRSVNEEE